MSENLKKRFFTSLALFVLLFLMIKNNYILGYLILIIGVLSVLEFFQMTSKIFKNKKFGFIFVNSFFIFYIFGLCALFISLSFYVYLKIVIFIILLTCIASDIGGFVIGKTIRGKKLTRISPNKTISGAVGSIVFSSIAISIMIFYITQRYDPLIIIAGFVISLACQIGDLMISSLKRKSNMKDTGSLLPGHGGILDRIDGILLGLPVGFIVLTFFIK